ncbi:hypothetical protein GCM10010443_92900 [Actinoplanes cyaneus]
MTCKPNRPVVFLLCDSRRIYPPLGKSVPAIWMKHILVCCVFTVGAIEFSVDPYLICLRAKSVSTDRTKG